MPKEIDTENLMPEVKAALKAAELELRGVVAVRSVHKQVLKAIGRMEAWEVQRDREYYRYEGEARQAEASNWKPDED